MLNLRCQMSESVFGRACVRARASVFYQTAMKSKTEFLHFTVLYAGHARRKPSL